VVDVVVSGTVLVVVVVGVETVVVIVEVVAVVEVAESDPAHAAETRARTVMSSNRFMCAKRFYASGGSRNLNHR
jgi:hypothetical protein